MILYVIASWFAELIVQLWFFDENHKVFMRTVKNAHLVKPWMYTFCVACSIFCSPIARPIGIVRRIIHWIGEDDG